MQQDCMLTLHSHFVVKSNVDIPQDCFIFYMQRKKGLGQTYHLIYFSFYNWSSF